MSTKVIVGQAERPNTGEVAAVNPQVEPIDTHIQRVADVTLMTAAEVAALPIILDLQSKAGSLIDPSEGGIEGLVLPVGAFPAGTLLTRIGESLEGRMLNSFTAKATPVNADLLLLSDSAASNALKSATLQSLAPLFTRTGNPFVDPPAVANALDDEFLSGSDPDLANRGYVVKGAGGGALTRAGNISAWTSPAAGTYYSQIIGSVLFVQPPATDQMRIQKAITLAAGDSIFTRVGGTTTFSPGSTGRYLEVGLYADSSGALDDNNRVFLTSLETTTAASYLQYDTYRVTAGASAGVSRNQYMAHDIRGVHYASGTQHDIFAVASANGQLLTHQHTGVAAAANLVWFGIRLTGGTGPSIFAIDYIRRKTSDNWIAG